MPNSSFEGGNLLYTLQSPFVIVDNAANAHTGSWELQANLNRTYHNGYQVFPCWKNTKYTSSIWYKGTGSVTFEILDRDWKTVLASEVLTADRAWKKAVVHWNSRSSTSTMIMLSDNVGTGAMYFDDVSTGLTDMQPISFDADDPARSNPQFHLVFRDEFNSPRTIDLNNTGAAGYNWYLQSFFDPKYNAKPSMFSVSDGDITFLDCGNNWGEVLDSAHPFNNSHGFIGTVFSGGKGLYTEARIAFATQKNVGGWWSTSMKGETKVHNVMAGNPGHKEAIENDFMEYDQVHWGWPPNEWGSTIHDWCDSNLANYNTMVACPVDTDFTKYHTYGMLWVPASAENGWHGYHQVYFDGQPQQAICWIGNQTYAAGVFPETSESMGSYLFSEMDNEQFMLILGGPQGGKPSMKVDYVRVYAVSNSSVTVVRP
jgi:hypothetical protein